MSVVGVVVLVLGLFALGSGASLKLSPFAPRGASLARKDAEKAAELSLMAGATAVVLGACLVMAGSV